MGYGAILPLAVYGPRGGLSTQFDAGHGEIHAGFLPEGMHQRGDFHFKCLPHGPYPFPPACCFTYPLQHTGVGHKPLWLPHALCHFSLGHELSDVEDSWAGGKMSSPQTLILHLHTARRHLVSDKVVPSAPDISGRINSYQGTSSSAMPWTIIWSQWVALQ